MHKARSCPTDPGLGVESMQYRLSIMARSTLTSSLTPVHLFSHGSTMMLGEESDAATYWKKAGDEALANKIKGVIMMVG